MTAETLDFVSLMFDEVFVQPELKTDPRFIRLKQMVKTLQNSRTKRKRGFVGVSLMVMDDLKYVDGNLRDFYDRCINGDISKLTPEQRENYNVYIAGFGDTVSKPGEKLETIDNSGWRGSLTDFITSMHAHQEDETEEQPHEEGEFYFANFPNGMINKHTTRFMMFVTHYQNDDEQADVAHIAIVGMPTDLREEMQERKILTMFGYK